MKRTLALILTVLLICTAITPSVLAAEEPGVSVEPETKETVADSNKDANVDNSISTPSDSDIVTDCDEATGQVNVETTQRSNDVESISIPDESTLGDNLDNTASVTGKVIAPALTATPVSITITLLDEPDRRDAVAFAVGTTKEELSNWFDDSVAGFTGYDADGNSYNLVSGEWSLDSVDTGTVGVYYASAQPDLGTEYTLADGVSLPLQLCAVSIQAQDEPDINCCVAARGFLRFPWVLSSTQMEQIDEFNLWLQQDSGEWENLNDGFSFVSDCLQISQQIFTYGHTYNLKVTYPGGQTGILAFQYYEELSILDYSSGDRDGGDTDGSDSVSGTQPAPTPSDSDEDDTQIDNDNTPTHGYSSSKTESTPQDSDPTPHGPLEPQELLEEQYSSSDKTHPTPTAPQKPSYFQHNRNNKSDNNSQVQPPVLEKPSMETTAVPIQSSIQVFSDTFFSHKAESTPSQHENDAVPQPKDSVQAVMNPVSNDNNIQSEKIPESQEPVAVTESYSPTQTVISGLRLRDLCNEEESVVFGFGNLTVSIPSKLLLALNVSDSDTLSVRLTKPESNKILLAVEVSGKSITALTGTVLRIRYMPKSENTNITIQSEDGKQIIDTFYDGEVLLFTVNRAGGYIIMEQSNAQKDGLPLLPVSGGMILIASGISFFVRRRHE